MKKSDISLARLKSHHLTTTTPASAINIVEWLGGMQAQEYEQAKWAIGSRIPGSTLEDIEHAIAKKSIVRTWLFRGTLHFACAKDVHWMLQLVAPALASKLKSRHAELGLKESQFDGFYSILEQNLKHDRELSRTELTEAFRQKGIDARGPLLYHILLKAALDQLICCGKKNDTFRLLEKSKKVVRREYSLKELAKRYFSSHGPATVADFSTWAGITLTDARNALEANSRILEKFEFEKKIYWYKESKNKTEPRRCILLAGFDEYYLGYKDKNISAQGMHTQHIVHKNGIFNPVVLIDGQVSGTWKRTFTKDAVTVEVNSFKPLHKSQKALVTAAAEEFSRFTGRRLQIRL